jgi:hypothetical protein
MLSLAVIAVIFCQNDGVAPRPEQGQTSEAGERLGKIFPSLSQEDAGEAGEL